MGQRRHKHAKRAIIVGDRGDKAKEEKRLIVPTKTTMKDVFVRLNLLKGDKLTNTAILLFGKEPQKYFVQAKIRVARFKYIEHWGRGTNRIVEAMREENLADPIFEELSGGLNVTLMGPGKEFEKAIEDAKIHKIDLNDRQKKAIEYMKKEGRITRTIYCQINGIGKTYAKKEIKDLIEKRVFRRIGDGKNTYYILVTE